MGLSPEMPSPRIDAVEPTGGSAEEVRVVVGVTLKMGARPDDPETDSPPRLPARELVRSMNHQAPELASEASWVSKGIHPGHDIEDLGADAALEVATLHLRMSLSGLVVENPFSVLTG